jgi:hypothetical protein
MTSIENRADSQEARSWPSGENATVLTEFECSSRVPRSAPVAASQSLTVRSSEAEARR